MVIVSVRRFVFLFFFFFQAEDGIRDYKVTGVQTCALPIYIANEFYEYFKLSVIRPDNLIVQFNEFTRNPKYQQIGRASCRERV